ncbi:Na+/H+ antiporter NhaC [Mesoflavibacter sp. HG96]|uniref:Na+/H+ antiporter NhaC n=1 Tax=Mesoflavibacter profundi TaxID=2708110 RepID=A0ABT4RYU1_9FLAO|nr:MULTISPECIES: Na+/H+ antiporter NhaC [Mesoflavibacter]MDA0176803.1 Na+/H+ antiporter NhaC [Mesoflavibacter profundi]QIJ90461.1 Na+/H+ antiporter NhaC [Mesoflavibacter sp. HG96]QIJ93189.1 Na+/H+ antiporter NhaC [Mesoflavibacter sp. HG37]
MKDKNLSDIEINEQRIVENKELNLLEALIPVVCLMALLAYNIFFVEDQEWFGGYTNQIILLIGGCIAAAVGFFNKVSFNIMLKEIWENLKSVFVPILILFLVGALAGTWLVSGIIPAMVYYGLQVLSPEIFLPASVVIAAIISIATGSSWTTSATVGIALIGIGSALGIPTGMIAGAVISGAYFGDKMSPLSDTTNLAPAMAGTDLFTHIRYMAFTTVPTIIVTLIVFTVLSSTIDTTGNADLSALLTSIDNTFNITPLLFIVPAVVIALILLKTKPLIALLSGVILAAVFSFIFQPDILNGLSDSKLSAIINAILTDTNIATDNEKLNELFSSGGMNGMIWTILLICCAMVFGGIMDAIGALARITNELLKIATTVFGLFASTVLSCLGLNAIASDQYLAIVIPGKMFKKAFNDKNLAPENLSRTLEDSGTVTSVLIPWNTCGAYQSGVLGVGVAEYFWFAIFNWLSPITTLIFAAFSIKIRQLTHK